MSNSSNNNSNSRTINSEKFINSRDNLTLRPLDLKFQNSFKNNSSMKCIYSEFVFMSSKSQEKRDIIISLENENYILKKENISLKNQLEDFEFKSNKLFSENFISKEKHEEELKKLKFELSELKRKNQILSKKEKIIKVNHNKLNNIELNTNKQDDNSVKQLVCDTLGNWKSMSNEKFKKMIEEEIHKNKFKLLEVLDKQVKSIISHLKLNYDNKLDFNKNGIISDVKKNHNLNVEIKLIFYPLKTLLETIVNNFEDRKLKIKNQLDELSSVQRSLEESINEYRSADISMNAEKYNEMKKYVENLKNENIQLKEKYKNYELEKKKKFEKKMLELDDKFNSMFKDFESNYNEKEQKIFDLLKKDSDDLILNLNDKFSKLIDDFKDELEQYPLTKSNKGQLYDKIIKLLTKFNNFAKCKIKESNNTILDISTSFAEIPNH